MVFAALGGTGLAAAGRGGLDLLGSAWPARAGGVVRTMAGERNGVMSFLRERCCEVAVCRRVVAVGGDEDLSSFMRYEKRKLRR